MDGTRGRHESQHKGRLTVNGAAIGIVMLITAGGCSDHRISLAEFVAIEQHRQEMQQSVPATQPAEYRQATNELIDRVLGPYRVGPGDVLTVLVTGMEEALPRPHPARVDRDGEIELPMTGRLKVAGQELEDVEKIIRDAYVPRVYMEAVVHVAMFKEEVTTVLVTGAVQTPGFVNLRRTERDMLHAVVTAGGASPASSGRATLRRVRRPTEEVTLNLLDPNEIAAALALESLQNGDSIKVESAVPNTVFVGGLVNANRPQPYPPGTSVTVLQALAASGGLRTDITPTEATLIRRMPDGCDVHVKLDLDRVQKGKDPNITLAAGDVLWVPYTVANRVEEWINRNIFFRAGVNATAGVNYNVHGLDYLNSNAQGYYNRGAGTQGGTLQDLFDPLGFLTQPALQPAVVAP